MAFHQVRFPLDIALGARGGPERKTDIVTLGSGAEERNSRWARSRRRYDAAYGVKSAADMQTVLAFFEERRGRFHAFRWRDGIDFSSTGGQGTPTPIDQPLGTGDGAQTAFQLVKRYGAAFDPYDRPIRHPVAGSVRVAIDGGEVAEPDFALDNLTGIVTFAAAPPPGAVLTAGFLFDVPVRFDTDRLDIERSSFDAASIGSIPLIEIVE